MKSILVVDDTPDNIDVLSGILSPTYRVLAAINGNSALRLVDKIAPDLILLDIVMPGMDGFEVLENLRDNEATRHIPVIMLSSKVDSAEFEKRLNGATVDFLSKPVDPAELKNCIESALADEQ